LHIAVLTTAALGLPTVVALAVSPITSLTVPAYLTFKVTFAVALGLIVSPVIALTEMR
jgi:hypothetical protein